MNPIRFVALALALAAAACSQVPTTSSPVATMPATVQPVGEQGQGGTDAAAGQLFGLGVTRPADTKTPQATWTFPDGGGTIETPLTTLHQKFDAAGKVTEQWYEAAIGPDGKPILQRLGSVAAYIDNRGGTITNSVTPQGAVTGSTQSQAGQAAPTATQTTTQSVTVTTSVPVTANVPVTLPNGQSIPAGGTIPAGTTIQVPTGGLLTPAK